MDSVGNTLEFVLSPQRHEQDHASSMPQRWVGTPAAVSQWLKRARLGGATALRAHPALGPTPLLDAAQLSRLLDLLQQGAAACGFLGEVWTRRRVAQLIQEHAPFAHFQGGWVKATARSV